MCGAIAVAAYHMTSRNFTVGVSVGLVRENASTVFQALRQKRDLTPRLAFDKPFMPCPRKALRQSYQHSRFDTARVSSTKSDRIGIFDLARLGTGALRATWAWCWRQNTGQISLISFGRAGFHQLFVLANFDSIFQAVRLGCLLRRGSCNCT